MRRRTNKSHAPTRHCEFAGCVNPSGGKPYSTQGGKPFCPKHLFQNKYAQAVSDANDAVKASAELAKRQRPDQIDVRGTIASEILRILQIDGQRTVERIGRDITYLDAEGADRYATALHNAGLVRLGRTSRGALTLELL